MKKRQKVPWVFRRWPPGENPKVTLLFSVVGALALMVFFIAGVFGVLTLPLQLAAQHPDAPIANPIRWLGKHLSKDAFLIVYGLVQMTVLWFIIYAIGIFDYLRFYGRSQDEKR